MSLRIYVVPIKGTKTCILYIESPIFKKPFFLHIFRFRRSHIIRFIGSRSTVLTKNLDFSRDRGCQRVSGVEYLERTQESWRLLSLTKKKSYRYSYVWLLNVNQSIIACGGATMFPHSSCKRCPKQIRAALLNVYCIGNTKETNTKKTNYPFQITKQYTIIKIG